MGPASGKGFSALGLAAFLASYCLASPLSSKLLPLVPPGAEIVSGFEYQPVTDKNRALLLTTQSDRADLDDWQALTGADSKRVYEDLIEVAATGTNGTLSEHMLFVAGRFDRERIFRSIQETGTEASLDAGHAVLTINPLKREGAGVAGIRWLAILDNRIGILGTPWLVQKAMHRYADHSVLDSVLEERLSLLRPDVTSWNLLAVSRLTAENILFGLPHTPWADLQRDTDVLMVAARFGSKMRIDFVLGADSEQGADFFMRKAEFFTAALKSGQQSQTAPFEPGRRPANLSLEVNRVHGSVELSSKQFEGWWETLYQPSASATHSPAHGD